jgi:hypothetical protein
LEVPLSEEEERILHQIEQNFYAHDPQSAKRLKSTTLPRYLARNCRWAALGFFAGLIVLLVSFASNWIVGIFGFVIMLGCAVVFAENLRRMGQHGWRQLASSMRSRDVAGLLEDTQRRLRKRFGRED